MKKSKLIALTLTFIFILTACGKSSNGYMFDYSQQATFSGMITVDGTIYQKGQKYNYLDFESGEYTVFCTKPGCTHDASDETCLATISSSGAYFIAGDKFYYTRYASTGVQESLKTEIVVSDINRQNERVSAVYDGIDSSFTYLHKDIAYFSTSVHQLDEKNSISNEKPISTRIIAYDCRNDEILAEIEMVNLYSGHTNLAYGVYNEKIYYQTGGTEIHIKYDDLTDEEKEDPSLFLSIGYIALDTETQEIQRSDTLSELLGIEIEIETPQFIIDDVLYYDTGGVIYAYNLNTNENDMVYDGEYEYTIQAGDKLIYHINWLENNSYIYDPDTKESRRIYRPENGDWALGSAYGLWLERGDNIYINSASNNGSIEGYAQYSPFIIKVHKDDIYKEEYEAEIVS